MIYPTPRAVYAIAAAAPVALLLGVVRPGGWVVAALWVVLMLVLILIDALLARPIGPDVLALDAPGSVGVGERVILRPAFTEDRTRAFAADVTPPLVPIETIPLGYAAPRRGRATIRRIWARHAGPLGLAFRQASRRLDRSIAVLPDLAPVREQGMRQYLRSRQHGARIRPESGEGNDFQALTDFRAGMERRAIDWKASARHASLLAREYRTERDNMVVLAIDAGRAMSDPVDGIPRIDRAVSAALLASFVALKSGDRVRLYSFAAKPAIDSGTLIGTRNFARLHDCAAAIDYASEESNYTLSLVTLDSRLERRSLIVLFTEFTDPTAAELMMAAARRMLKRHRLLFVLFHDVELETIRDAAPERPEDVVRANVAHTLLRERRIVIERLRRLGAEVLEAGTDDLALALVERYNRMRERA